MANSSFDFSKLSKNPTPVLVILLVVAAFLIGSLFTKVSYLEKGGGTVSGTQIGTTAPSRPPAGTPGPTVSIDKAGGVGHLPSLGNKNAKVEVIEFGDFQCPFCGRFYTDVEKQLIKDYVDTGKVKFAFRHYAFLGQESTSAAEASECANEQNKFWEYHNYLYENQKGENQGAFSKDNLKSFATTLGLNASQFNTCLDSGKYTKNVTNDFADGQKAGVNGTPATFVNGQLVSGAQPFASFKTLIDQELGK